MLAGLKAGAELKRRRISAGSAVGGGGEIDLIIAFAAILVGDATVDLAGSADTGHGRGLFIGAAIFEKGRGATRDGSSGGWRASRGPAEDIAHGLDTAARATRDKGASPEREV